eukprot:297944-Lingulodinium_polyedra.AAC.1
MEETTMEIEPPPGLFGPRVSQTTDYWTKAGTTWTRHRVSPREKPIKPIPMSDGPDAKRLADTRMTKQ